MDRENNVLIERNWAADLQLNFSQTLACRLEKNLGVDGRMAYHDLLPHWQGALGDARTISWQDGE